MANYVRRISKDAKDYEHLPEFIRNLANLVFLMNDRKGMRRNKKKKTYFSKLIL